MRVEEVYQYDVVWIKAPDKEDLIPCRIVSINTDNVMTGEYFDGDGLIKRIRIDGVLIKRIDPHPDRDPNGRRVVVYCLD